MLAFFCVALMQKRVGIDPLIVVIPCALLVPGTLDLLPNLFINVLPGCALLALFSVFLHRNSLQIEACTRMAAGAGLGAFIAIQVLGFGLPVTILLLLLFCISLFSIFINAKSMTMDVVYKSPISLLLGLGIGAIQFMSLSSGRALLPSQDIGRASVVWLVAILGALVGWIAVPNETIFHLNGYVMFASIVGVLMGVGISFKVNANQFESKVLFGVVLVMTLSVWAHILIKNFLF